MQIPTSPLFIQILLHLLPQNLKTPPGIITLIHVYAYGLYNLLGTPVGFHVRYVNPCSAAVSPVQIDPTSASRKHLAAASLEETLTLPIMETQLKSDSF